MFADKIFNKLAFIIAKNTSVYNIKVQIQEELYQKYGLSRKNGLKKLNKIIEREFNYSYSECNGMFSEHLIIMSALSIKYPKTKRILEIGTYDGRTALILSHLFPLSEIITIDLSENDPMFYSTYNRSSELKEFVENRNNLIFRMKNIKYLPMNSLQLSMMSMNFDLIWLDGAHGYPFIACDLINAIRLLKKNGFLLVDDVWKSRTNSHMHYRSIGGYETIVELKNANLINDFYLFHKRLAGKFNYYGAQKFVAVMRRQNNKIGKF